MVKKILQVLFPILLGGIILYWMYRGMDIRELLTTMGRDMHPEWMLLSLPFGILAQVMRGWRWKQTLDPVDEHPRSSSCIHSIFVSYAVSLVVPRIGEVMRCGLLRRYDGTSFTKSLGTVVTERVVDSLLVLIITGITLLCQMPVFLHFFQETGVDMSSFLGRFSHTGYLVTLVCLVVVLLFVGGIAYRLKLVSRIKNTFLEMLAGMNSIKHVSSPAFYWFNSIGIWVCYFFHFFLTFYAFGFTEHLGWMAGLVCFVVGTIAVVVPTPNGAGPWHFAVKTILVLYGIGETQAVMFALIVHSVQTLLLILMGCYGGIALLISGKWKSIQNL
jgi:uncharacterized protein (TIRG00374 family)